VAESELLSLIAEQIAEQVADRLQSHLQKPVHSEFQIAFKNWPAVALCNIVTPRYSTSLSANSVIRHRQVIIAANC
jgi:hypothetical protein